ncbi:unnamed protein product, partial [Phaeothamnion confervicola]
LSKRIAEQARLQRREEEEEEAAAAAAGAASAAGNGKPVAKGVTFPDADAGSDDGGESASEMDDSNAGADDDDGNDDEYEDAAAGAGMSAAEEALVAGFMGAGGGQRRTLADIIMDKIREKEAGAAGADGDGEDDGPAASTLPPKVIEVYTQVAGILKHYTAGKLPKAFKIIPSLVNWEEVVWLTRPDEWSPHAVLAATRIFASNLSPHMAQRFFNVFLLERCRADIQEHKRLNFHLYEALVKSVYKPAAFFKGVLLPLAAARDCSLREATIFASVLAKVSIPANHSAVAILKLAEMPYAGGTSLFLRVLLNKKYALPHRVIDALVDHFVRFEAETRQLPVLWHQSLLVFVQRYKADIKPADKERLKGLLKAQPHHQMTPEIRRELFSAQMR